MKYFIQFQQLVNGKMRDRLGSDGVYLLDGRNSLQTMKLDAAERAAALKNIFKVDAYVIMKGSCFCKAVAIYHSVKGRERAVNREVVAMHEWVEETAKTHTTNDTEKVCRELKAHLKRIRIAQAQL